MYKIVHGLMPSYRTNLLSGRTIGRYNLRHRPPLNIPFARLETYKQSFIVYASELWNTLSSDIQNVPSVSFKCAIKNKDEPNVLYYYG